MATRRFVNETPFQGNDSNFNEVRQFPREDKTKAAEYMRSVLLKLKVDKSVALLEHELDKVLAIADKDPDGPSELKFGNCRCYHPPSIGFCIFGLCVTGGKWYIEIKFNF